MDMKIALVKYIRSRTDMSLEEMGNIVSGSIRNTDSIGMRKDKNIYLLLAQTNEKSLEIVKARLLQKGIKLER